MTATTLFTMPRYGMVLDPSLFAPIHSTKRYIDLLRAFARFLPLQQIHAPHCFRACSRQDHFATHHGSEHFNRQRTYLEKNTGQQVNLRLCNKNKVL